MIVSLRIAACALALVCAACSAPPADDADTSTPLPDSTITGADASADAALDAASGAADTSVSPDATSDLGELADTSPGPDLGDCTPAPSDLAPLTTMPSLLSQTGLYADIETRTLTAGIVGFEPRFPLWSDGAQKSRFVYLPSCPKIDNADPDHWSLPVGARFWKHFEVDGVILETRFFHRFGNGPDDFYFGAFVWAEDGSDATLTISGVEDARGTTHDVPSIHGCEGCHLRVPERILGFGAVQLDHDGPGVTLDSLANHLTIPAAVIELPGDATAQAALGYLHANCGNCHNETPLAVSLQSRPLDLRLSVADRTLADTGVSRTAIGVPVDRFSHETCDTRIVPGAALQSCLVLRMDLRGADEQMPPLGSEVADTDGIAAISAWIDAL